MLKRRNGPCSSTETPSPCTLKLLCRSAVAKVHACSKRQHLLKLASLTAKDDTKVVHACPLLEQRSVTCTSTRSSLGRRQLKDHVFFEGIDWLRLSQRHVLPPYMPKVKGDIGRRLATKENYSEGFATYSYLKQTYETCSIFI